MNKKCVLLAMAILLGGYMNPSNAFSNSPNQSTIVALAEWEKVKTENGIDIYVSTVEVDGESYLKVKFENATAEAINFSWTLTKNDETLVDNMVQKIAVGNAIEIFDVTMLFKAKNNELNDFTITTKLNK